MITTVLCPCCAGTRRMPVVSEEMPLSNPVEMTCTGCSGRGVLRVLIGED